MPFEKITDVSQLKLNQQYLVKLKAEYPWFIIAYASVNGKPQLVNFFFDGNGHEDYTTYELEHFKEVFHLPN